MIAEKLEKRTPRDIVETLLLEHFPANLRPSRRRAPGANLHSDQNIFSKSSNFPSGLVYEGKGAIFGVDISFRLNNPVIPRVQIVSPRGEKWQQAADHFARRLLDLIPEAELVVDSNIYKVTY